MQIFLLTKKKELKTFLYFEFIKSIIFFDKSLYPSGLKCLCDLKAYKLKGSS